MFKHKYLKYKTKYLNLKNQIAGTITLNEKCEQQQKDNTECTSCVYFHYSEQKNQNIANPVNTQPNDKNFSKPQCEKVLDKIEPKFNINTNIIYFNDVLNELQNFYYYDLATNQIIEMSDKTILMNEEDYYSIMSYHLNESNELIISQYDKTISTLCREGNIVWTNKESKVGSGGVDSCLFVALILNDDTKICMHHNINDSFNIATFNNITQTNNIRKILSKSHIGEVKHIYLCMADKEEQGNYTDIINYYKSLTSSIHKICGTRFLVGKDNLMYILQEQSNKNCPTKIIP